MRDDELVSPCGTMVAFDPSSRGLVLKRFGVTEETARPDRLLLDFDLPRVFQRRRLTLRAARKMCPISIVRAVCSKVGLHPIALRYDRTARGFHVVVFLPWSERLTRAEIVAMQACLGSDPWRESLNLSRVRALRQFGAPPAFRSRWNLLFREKLA